MQITRQSLVSWEAARAVTAWFDTAFPAGSGDYQAVLDALAAADRPEDAHWLMDEAGPDEEAVLEVDELTGRHCFAAGRLVVRGRVDLARDLRAGGDIDAGGDLSAGGDIWARGDILAAGDIVAGGYIDAAGAIRADGAIRAAGVIWTAGGVRAGGDILVTGYIQADGDIICPTRPERIARGAWRAPEAEAEDSPASVLKRWGVDQEGGISGIEKCEGGVVVSIRGFGEWGLPEGQFRWTVRDGAGEAGLVSVRGGWPVWETWCDAAWITAADQTVADWLRVSQYAQPERPRASPDLIATARAGYAGDDIQIDDDAVISQSADGTWVSAWVFVEGESPVAEADEGPSP